MDEKYQKYIREFCADENVKTYVELEMYFIDDKKKMCVKIM